jgi:hypothetical protein
MKERSVGIMLIVCTPTANRFGDALAAAPTDLKSVPLTVRNRYSYRGWTFSQARRKHQMRPPGFAAASLLTGLEFPGSRASAEDGFIYTANGGTIFNLRQAQLY